MVKKGDLLNQLAIVSDLLEKVNATTKSTTLVFEVSNSEFERIFDYMGKKQSNRNEKPKDKFTITIGAVDIVFSTNNV
jgi:hypothetical protein